MYSQKNYRYQLYKNFYSTNSFKISLKAYAIIFRTISKEEKWY